MKKTATIRKNRHSKVIDREGGTRLDRFILSVITEQGKEVARKMGLPVDRDSVLVEVKVTRPELQRRSIKEVLDSFIDGGTKTRYYRVIEAIKLSGLSRDEAFKQVVIRYENAWTPLTVTEGPR